MVKLQLKQLLAANRFEEAIERLRQSESIAAKNNDMEQAFELAKLQIGLLVKIQSTAPDSQSAGFVATAQQIEATSGTYANLTGAAELNQFAESLLMNAWKMEIDATEKSRLWKLYEQHCSDHLEQWPLSTTSPSVRQQLAMAFLATGRLESNLQLWINTPKEVDDRSEQLVNALLLFSSITRPKEIATQWRVEVISLKSPWQQLSRWLLTDWSWWTLGGGIDWGIDGKEANSEPLNVDSIAAFIPDAAGKAPDKSTPTTNQSLDGSILQLCGWIEKAPVRRMGCALATANAYLAIIDDQFAFGKQPLVDSDRTTLSVTLKRLENVLQKIENEANKSLHLSVSQAVDDLRVSLNSRVEAIELNSSQPFDELHQELINRQRTFPRSAKWQQEVAMIQLWHAKSKPTNYEALIEKSIQAYLKLASGNTVGSDGWFDARLRLARCYLLLGKDAQARETVALTTAMAGKIPTVWQKRSGKMFPSK
jgi:hypothetical protein